MTQARLDDYIPGPGARAADPDTSIAAAVRRLEGRQTDRLSALCWLSHAARTGMTDFELAECMGRQQTSAGKRRGELRDWGLVEDSGERRAAPSGSGAIVWRITTAGERVVERLEQGE